MGRNYYGCWHVGKPANGFTEESNHRLRLRRADPAVGVIEYKNRHKRISLNCLENLINRLALLVENDGLRRADLQFDLLGCPAPQPLWADIRTASSALSPHEVTAITDRRCFSTQTATNFPDLSLEL